MRTRLEQTLALVGCISICLGLFAACSSKPVNREGTPISVVVSTTGGLFGDSWKLSVNADGKALLRIKTFPNDVRTREFKVSADQLKQLQEVLEKERFLDLQPDYGERVPDGSTTTISVVKGGVKHSVRLHFLMNWAHGSPWKLKEPARAVRVYQVIRAWSDDEGAAASKEYTDIVLKAAGRTDK